MPVVSPATDDWCTPHLHRLPTVRLRHCGRCDRVPHLQQYLFVLQGGAMQPLVLRFGPGLRLLRATLHVLGSSSIELCGTQTWLRHGAPFQLGSSTRLHLGPPDESHATTSLDNRGGVRCHSADAASQLQGATGTSTPSPSLGQRRSPGVQLLRRLEAILPGRVTAAAAVLQQHGKDESYLLPLPPDVVAFPESTEDVAKVVAACSQERVPVIAFGAGTSVEGHVGARHGGVCLDMGRMNRVLAFAASDMDCRVQVSEQQTAHVIVHAWPCRATSMHG